MCPLKLTNSTSTLGCRRLYGWPLMYFVSALLMLRQYYLPSLSCKVFQFDSCVCSYTLICASCFDPKPKALQWCCCCCCMMNATVLLQLPCQDRTRSRGLTQRTGPDIHWPLQKSDHVKGWLHQRLCETESRAHSETGTDTVVILHKTLNLTFYKRNAGIHIA